jgi:hypothetical protein
MMIGKASRSGALLVALKIALISTSHAAIYYVDYASGSDSRTGLTESQAWKRCPGDPGAAGVARTTQLAPGDTVRFRRGVSYVGTVDLNWSGSAGKPITYDGNAWGSGERAIITTRNTTIWGFNTQDNARNWLVLANLDFYDIGGIADNHPLWTTPDPNNYANRLTSVPNGLAIRLHGGGTDIVVRNCRFREIGQWIPKKPVASEAQITGYGISLEDNSRVLISNCEFTRMSTPISIKARKQALDVTVADCEIHDYVRWGIDVAPRASGAKFRNITVLRTTIRDYHQYDADNWKAWGEKPHTDGIFFRSAIYDSIWENILVDQCHFYADEYGPTIGGSASVFFAEGASGTVRNSVFTGKRHGMGDIAVAGRLATTQKQVVYIHNNTFFGMTRPVCIRKESSTRRQVHILNNIMYRPTTAYHHIFCEDLKNIAEMDYNQYYGDNTEARTPIIGGVLDENASNYNLAALRNIGFDKNGFWAHPSFVRMSYSVITEASKNDLHLTDKAPAIGRGKNLSYLFGVDHDAKGRPSSGKWTIGAYEKAGESVEPSVPSAPQNLRLVGW